MMQKDYFMRVIEQFVQAILGIIRQRKAENYKEARELVLTTGRYLLRMNTELLLLYHPDQLLDHFKDFSGQLETEKCVLAADLFYELALIEEAEKRPDEALRIKKLCLHLYTSGLPKEKKFQQSEYFMKIAALMEELADKPLSAKVRSSLEAYQAFMIQSPK